MSPARHSRQRRRTAHVYFYALPRGERFTHQGQRYTKVGEEAARDRRGKVWDFGINYGCLITKARADALRIPSGDYLTMPKARRRR